MRLKWLSILAVLLAWATAPAYALTGTFKEVGEFGDNPGDLRMFSYVPAGLPKDRAVPLVVALHGCLQTAQDFYQATGWAGLADDLKFILLLPQQQAINNPMSCFGWYEPENQKAGDGEPASIASMIKKVKDAYRVREDAIYVTGLSAGAAMTGVMLATYPEIFAGGAILAGPPYRCAEDAMWAAICMGPGHPNLSPEAWAKLVTDDRPFAGKVHKVSIWIGSEDTVVNPGNLTEDMEQWTQVLKAGQTPVKTETVASPVEHYKTHQPFNAVHSVFGNAADPLVETWVVQGMGHAVPIDANGKGQPQIKCGTNRYDMTSLDQNPQTNNYMVDAGLCAVRHIAQFWGLLK